jgi:hypothetical protein
LAAVQRLLDSLFVPDPQRFLEINLDGRLFALFYNG